MRLLVFPSGLIAQLSFLFNKILGFTLRIKECDQLVGKTKLSPGLDSGQDSGQDRKLYKQTTPRHNMINDHERNSTSIKLLNI